MKGNLLTIILCLFYFVNLNAQSFLVLSNAEKIDYKKYKIISKDHTIEIKKPKAAIIKIEDIDFLVNKKGEIHYLRPAVESDILFEPDYALMEKIIDGKITILKYSKTTTLYTGPNGTSSITATYYFIEKDEKFSQIPNEALQKKKKYSTKRFRNYFSDDQEVLDLLNANETNEIGIGLIDLIRKYNINAASRDLKTEETELCNAILFRGYSNQSDKLVAEIEINDQNFSLTNMLTH